MDILLTDSAIDSLLERAWVEVYGGIERVDRQRTKEVMQTAQLLCRAQVRKVVEFYQQIPVAGRPMHDVWADFLEALREAAGEG